MNQKTRIILLLLFLIIGGSFLLFYKIRDLETKQTLTTNAFVRNLSWQTGFLPNVPFKKGDELEFSSVLSTDRSESLRIGIDKIRNLIDIEKIEWNDHTITEADLNHLSLQDSGILKVTGKSKNFSTEEQPAVDLFNITPIQNTTASGATVTGSGKTDETPKPNEKILPPTNLSLSATAFNSNINNLLVITGKHLEDVAFVNIGWVRFKPVLFENKLNVSLDHDLFSSGEYFVFYELTNGKLVTSDAKITFEHSDATINIAGLTPNTIRNDIDRFITLQGNGFNKIISIQLNNNLILKNAEFTIINEHVAGVKIPKGLPPGEYYFNIMDTGSIYELKNMKFTITQ